MLDEEKILILDKNDKDITSKVIGQTSTKIIVDYGKKSYPYKVSSLKIISNPTILKNCIISTPTITLSNVCKVIKFENYIKVFFSNRTTKLYNESNLIIKSDILNDYNISNVFNYFKEMASNLKISDIIPEAKKEKDNSAFLSKKVENKF